MNVTSASKIPPVYSYALGFVIAATSWYGWRYEILFYGGDLAYYGPLARLAGWVTRPITGGVNFLPPSNPATVFLLTWLIWVLLLRLLCGVWNSVLGSRAKSAR